MSTEQKMQSQAEPSYWEEEARRYAGNADFWREQCAKRDDALDTCVEALENIKSDYAAHDGKRWDIDAAITQAEKALK